MKERLIELFIPIKYKDRTQEILNSYAIEDFWCDKISEKKVIFRILASADLIEAMLDLFQKNFHKVEGFKVIVLPVEATIPRPETESDKKKETNTSSGKQLSKTKRISREELYADIIQTSKISKIYILMVVISSLVASIGLMRDNVAMIIGAMVIAPLLGPNVALSLTTTLADFSMLKSSLRTLFLGIIIALIISLTIGFFFNINISSHEMISRTQVSIGDIVLALASGIAGVLSYTAGLSSSLIGVMVAVALLPPLVNTGLLIGSGHFVIGASAFLIFITNMICINLAGVITFYIQGIRPRTWWEAKKAKKATRISLFIWTTLFIILIMLIVL